MGTISDAGRERARAGTEREADSAVAEVGGTGREVASDVARAGITRREAASNVAGAGVGAGAGAGAGAGVVDAGGAGLEPLLLPAPDDPDTMFSRS